jgi:hypothetical protein
MRKKNPGKNLTKAINTTLSMPNIMDKFIKDHPHLNENEAFVHAVLGIKRIISESRLLFTMVFDTVAKLIEDEEDDESGH